MTMQLVSTAAAVIFVVLCFSNSTCALWLLNTRYQRAALTYRLGMMVLCGGAAMAGLGIIVLPHRPIFPSDLVMQLGLSLMFGLLARDQKRLGGHGERRRHVS